MSVSATPESGRRWAKTEEAADYLRLDPEVLRRMNRERAKYPWLPVPRRMGKELRWDLDEMDAALDARMDDELS